MDISMMECLVRLNQHAKLAVLTTLALMALASPLLVAMAMAQPPLQVRFQLADGIHISGELTSWDQEGFDGSFGQRRWGELMADDVWRLQNRLIDKQSASAWVKLGRVLLLMAERQPKASALAERAFRQATHLDGSVAREIEKIREEVAAEQKKQNEINRAAEAARLKTTSPEAETWQADPWPVLIEREQQAAVLTMRTDAQRIVEKSGLNVAPVETEHFLLYTDCPRVQAAAWAMNLEKTFKALRSLLERSTDPIGSTPGASSPTIWGKIVVLVFQDQDRFRLVESDAFKQLVPLGTIGMAHMAGPKAFVVLYRADDDELFQWTLLHETVHALMHCYRTPRRLPAWANEGLAEFVTGSVLKQSTVGMQRRQAALVLLRTGADATQVLLPDYSQASWVSGDGSAIPIASLMIELLFREQPGRTMQWINSVKDGDEWQGAFEKSLRMNFKALVTTATQYYKVND
jgi:hypothetical protein